MHKRTKNVLLLIVALSVALRVAAAFYLGNRVTDLPGTADQISYHTLAQRVLGGHGFSFGEAWWPATKADAPTAHWSYLYTAYLVVVYALVGVQPLAARLIQAVLVGILHPLLVYWLGRQVFGRVTGLAAALLTAVYAYFIYYAGTLMTEPFYISAILATLGIAIFMTRHWWKREAPDEQGSKAGLPRFDLKLGLLLGAVLAAAVMLRQLFLLVIPFIFLWVLWISRGRRWKELLVAGLVVAAAILPFTIYNYARFDRFVLLNTNAGFAFFWGNHPIYGTHFVPILTPEMGSYLSLIPENLRHLDEAALDQALLKLAIQFILADPLRYILLSLSRIPSYFMFWSSPESGTVSNLARVLSFGLLWPIMLVGLFLPGAFLRSRPAEKTGTQGDRTLAPVWLLYLYMTAYTVIHLLTWTLIRYRLPVDAVLLVFAGLAIVYLMERVPALSRLVKSLA